MFALASFSWNVAHLLAACFCGVTQQWNIIPLNTSVSRQPHLFGASLYKDVINWLPYILVSRSLCSMESLSSNCPGFGSRYWHPNITACESTFNARHCNQSSPSPCQKNLIHKSRPTGRSVLYTMMTPSRCIKHTITTSPTPPWLSRNSTHRLSSDRHA